MFMLITTQLSLTMRHFNMHHVYNDCTQNNAATSHKVLYDHETISRAGKVNASPWAVKKINSKCATKQLAVYQKRLNEEAKLLKGINHPNIVGKIQQSAHFKGCYILCLIIYSIAKFGCVQTCFFLTLCFSHQGFRAFTTAKDGSKCLAMEYGGEKSLNDLIEKRREDGLKAFPAPDIEKVAVHVARGLQVCDVF